MSNEITPNHYASIVERFFAFMLDCLLMALCLAGLIYVAASLSAEPPVVKFWHIFVVEWIYFTAQHSSKRRATVGMRILGLQIIDMNAQRITLMTASLRYIVSITSSLLLWIGHLMMLTNDLRQTLHDKVAGTLVVKMPQTR